MSITLGIIQDTQDTIDYYALGTSVAFQKDFIDKIGLVIQKFYGFVCQ